MSEDNTIDMQVNDLAPAQGGTVTAQISMDQALAQEEPPTSNVPEKFQNADGTVNVEALANSYLELEKGITQAPPEPNPEINPTDDSGFDLQPYYDKFATGQAIGEEDINTISAGMNIPKELVQTYVDLKAQEVQAVATNTDATIYDTLGGEDTYNKMSEWAGKNLSDEQLVGLNAQLDNPLFAQNGAILLKSMYENAVGKEPEVTPQPSASVDLGITDADEFQSRTEVLAAQRDPKYLANDPRTHAIFDAKLARWMARQQG